MGVKGWLFPDGSTDKKKSKPKAKRVQTSKLSTDWCKSEGLVLVGSVERQMQFAEYTRKSDGVKRPAVFRKWDLYGIADLMACSTSRTVLIQTTTASNLGTHVTKYQNDPDLRGNIGLWLKGPGREFEVHGWEVQTKRLRRVIFSVESWEDDGPLLGTRQLETLY